MGTTVGPRRLRRPERWPLPESLGRVAAGPLSDPQPATPLQEGAGGISHGHRSRGRERREGRKRTRGHLTSPRRGAASRSSRRACDSQAPADASVSRILRPPRPRSAHASGAVPRLLAVPWSRRRTRTGQARDSGSRRAGGRRGAGGGVLSRGPAPRRPAPSEARARPRARAYPGITCWGRLSGAPRPRRALRAPPARAGLRQDAPPAPRISPGPLVRPPECPAHPPAGWRAPDTQLLR